MPASILALLQAPDRQALEELLSDSVCFHSPVADYEGRGDVAHLLSLIATVLEELRLTRAFATSASRTSFVEAVVGGRPVQGVLDERLDEFGQVVEATLMLRPLSALRAAVDAMAQALRREPLPSQVLPTVAALAWAHTVADNPWLALPVGVLNGALVCWLLGRATVGYLGPRLAATFMRIRYGLRDPLVSATGSFTWLEATSHDYEVKVRADRERNRRERAEARRG